MLLILKVVFIFLGIVFFFRLIINIVVFSCGIIVVLWFVIVNGFVSKWLVFVLVLYLCFSFLCLVLVRKSIKNRKMKYVEWKLVRKFVVRLVGFLI